MNIFLKKQINFHNNFNSNLYLKKELKIKNILKNNYGISRYSAKELKIKNKLSIVYDIQKSNKILNLILNKNSLKFNRFLKLNKFKIIDGFKKQASWKGLRIRQGLPLNGQRTHTNARTAKRLVLSLNHI